MTQSAQIAKHLREVHFGGNWTTVNLRDTVSDVTLQQATTKFFDFNTIATLLFHVNYYVGAALQVLTGMPLNAKDEFSFAHPDFRNEEEWQDFQMKVWQEAESLAALIEALPESRLKEHFAEEKYGNYFRNLVGIIEHMHYHLGQIVLLKKLVSSTADSATPFQY